MDTVSAEQAEFIAELIYNFIHNFPIGQSEQKKLSRKKAFTDISNLKRSYKFRKGKIKLHKKDIINLVEKYHKQLLTLLV